MGKSHNPEGTAQVTDSDVVDALWEAYNETDEDTLAATSRDVADRLPIKRPAVKKRLDKMAIREDRVKRFKGAQAYLYYPEEESNNPDTPVQAATPATAPVEPSRRGWREYLSRAIAVVVGEPSQESKAWYDHPGTSLEISPQLVYLFAAFISFSGIPWISGVLLGISVPVSLAVVSGLIGMVAIGLVSLAGTWMKAHPTA